MLNFSFSYTNWNNTQQKSLYIYHSNNKKKTWKDPKNWLDVHQQCKYASYFKIEMVSQIRCQISDDTSFCDVLVKQQIQEKYSMFECVSLFYPSKEQARTWIDFYFSPPQYDYWIFFIRKRLKLLKLNQYPFTFS